MTNLLIFLISFCNSSKTSFLYCIFPIEGVTNSYTDCSDSGGDWLKEESIIESLPSSSSSSVVILG